MQSAMETVLTIVVVLGWVACIVVNALKGKAGFTVFAFFGSPWSLIGVSRLARPKSWWYRKRYDDAKRARVDSRYKDGRYWPSPIEVFKPMPVPQAEAQNS
jgi:hypothetical protein